jgi:outer membrane protein W
MKKFILSTIFAVALFAANAQSDLTFRRFKLDLSAGYVVTTGDTSGNGVLFSFEPKFAINDFVTIGLRTEMAISITGDASYGTVKGTGSYLLTGDYYFNTNKVRPFAGAGIGIYRHASADIGSTEEIIVYSKFGYAPRIGIEAGHFRTALEYNFAGKAADINKNYLGIKIGFLIGGGRIEE